jgi:phosphate transport system permease protein
MSKPPMENPQPRAFKKLLWQPAKRPDTNPSYHWEKAIGMMDLAHSEIDNAEKTDEQQSGARAPIDASLHAKNKIADRIFYVSTLLAAGLVLLIFTGIVFALVLGAMPALKTFGWNFLTNAQWDPVQDQFGALAPIVGTLVTSFIALLIAVPLSFGIALFLTELAPIPLRSFFGVAIELLAAIPSIIYGMWGLFIFAPFFAKNVEPWINENLGTIPGLGIFFRGPSMGIGVLTASLILAIMIIPYVTATMRDVFTVVPSLLKESAYGLGATTWEVAWKVVLPHTRVGVIGGIMLGLGRALGETMAVTFVIGNSHDLSPSLLMPGNTISSSLANEFTEAVGEMHTAALIELGLLLFLITFIVLALSRLLLYQLKKNEGRIS